MAPIKTIKRGDQKKSKGGKGREEDGETAVCSWSLDYLSSLLKRERGTDTFGSWVGWLCDVCV